MIKSVVSFGCFAPSCHDFQLGESDDDDGDDEDSHEDDMHDEFMLHKRDYYMNKMEYANVDA